MNFQYLKAFYVTVKLNSISKAAKSLHITQPGLSMQIQALEKELQVNLLKRSNKGVELTKAGKIVFDYADTILSLKNNIERDLDNLRRQKNQLILGSCKTIGEYALPCSLYTYKNSNKDIDIKIEIKSSEKVLYDLIKRNINIGIIQGNTNDKDIITEKIDSDRLLLVTSLPITKNKISIEEFKKLPIVIQEEGSGIRRCIQNILEENNIRLDDLNIIYELNSLHAIKLTVLSSKYTAFIPESVIKRELREGILTKIQIENIEISTDFYIAYRKYYELKVFEKEFISFIKSYKRNFCKI